MCGIAGIRKADGIKPNDDVAIGSMVNCIGMRGPDAQAVWKSGKVVLGHTRLSIIDISERSNQPMTDQSGRYVLVFNGEIYNFKILKSELENSKKVIFKTDSDTEVLLYGLIHYGSAFINRLNGFFAFCFYDKSEDRLLLARDRFGIKPVFYYSSDNTFAFASNLSALAEAMPQKKLNHRSLSTYFQLSYIPSPHTILVDAKKLNPGTFLEISPSGIAEQKYYSLPATDFAEAQPPESKYVAKFRSLLQSSVSERLIADVPIGTFLSGGIDSSVITYLAQAEKPNIPVFSIGFPDQPFFDESDRAAIIAKHLKLDHHIVQVREREIDEKLQSVLDAIDEPFADSSAVLVNLLSEQTRKEVKVALSGDGADETMGGYNKHRALLQSLDNGMTNRTLRATSKFWKRIPESRNTKTLNYFRKLKRYSQGLDESFSERFISWASFTPRAAVTRLLRNASPAEIPDITLDEKDFNSVLRADVNLILPNDMLYKVDLMSMYQSLEVRVPFLDHHLVDFLFKLPASQKIDRNRGKKILRKAFEREFPAGFFDAPKRGFEAPLSYWFQGPLKGLCGKYLSESFIEKQGLFHFTVVKELEQKAISKYPGDSPHTLWALIVFQYWYEKQFELGRH